QPAGPPQGEAPPTAIGPVAEVVAGGDVGDLHRLGVAHQLEAHAGGNLRHPPRVAGDAHVCRVGAGIGDPAGGREGAAPEKRLGLLRPRHYSSIGYGNLAETPPSTTRVSPLT